MPAQMDDITLIQHFIEGDLLLVANYRLRVQPAQDMVQLLGHSGQFIAWAKHTTFPASFGVRVGSEYAKLLNQTLLEHEFVPLGVDASQRFTTYEYHPVPAGHELNYTAGKELWKYWWKHRKQLSGPNPSTELLVFAHRQWAKVVQIDFQETTLFVQTEAGELALQNQDSVVWVHPIEPATAADKTVLFVGQPPVSRPPWVPSRSLDTTQPRSGGRSAGRVAERSQAAGVSPPASALNYVDHHSEHELIIETPRGKVVVEGEHLAYHVLR